MQDMYVDRSMKGQVSQIWPSSSNICCILWFRLQI